MEQTTYTTILHEARRSLRLSLNEYCIGDYIYRISKPICRVDEEKIGKSIGLSRATAYRAIAKLEQKALLIRIDEGLQMTEKWVENVEQIRLKVRRKNLNVRQNCLKVRRPSIYNNKNNNNISASPFSFKEELEKLKQSKQRHIQLIGEYLEEIGYTCDDEKEFLTTWHRHLRDAADLAKYPDEKIGKATRYAVKEYKKTGYNLGTLVKIITNNYAER